jgi:DNA-binding transcriptional regulator YbjK
VITFEMYLAALRNPALRAITQSWLNTSRTVLERYVDPSVARGVDALVEGLVLHSILPTEPAADRAEIADYVDQALGVDLSLSSHLTDGPA